MRKRLSEIGVMRRGAMTPEESLIHPDRLLLDIEFEKKAVDKCLWTLSLRIL